MACKGPVVNGNESGSQELARGHAIPLRVEQDLQVVRAGLESDGKDGDARVRLIDHVGRKWRIGRVADRVKGLEGNAGGGVEDRDLHDLALQGQGSGGSVDGDGRIGVHAPLDLGGDGSNVILKKHLLSAVNHANTTLDGTTVTMISFTSYGE